MWKFVSRLEILNECFPIISVCICGNYRNVPSWIVLLLFARWSVHVNIICFAVGVAQFYNPYYVHCRVHYLYSQIHLYEYGRLIVSHFYKAFINSNCTPVASFQIALWVVEIVFFFCWIATTSEGMLKMISLPRFWNCIAIILWSMVSFHTMS